MYNVYIKKTGYWELQKILTITSSAREHESISSQLSMIAGQEIEKYFYDSQVIQRDLSNSELPFMTNQWVDAYYTDKSQRNPGQIASLRKSDFFINELKNTESLIIGMPIYNFGMPAALKSYCDLICRAGTTYKVTDKGHVGLLADRPTYIIVASAKIAMNTEDDYATPHLIKILNLIGIHNIHLIDATRLQSKNVGKRIAAATHQIEEFIFQHYGEPATETA